MFDDETLRECLRTILRMTQDERQQRAQQLTLLLEEEIKRRTMLAEENTPKKRTMFGWLNAVSGKLH